MEQQDITVTCFNNDGKQENGQTLTVPATLDWTEFKTRVSQALSLHLESNTIIYNEIGGEIQSLSDVVNNDKLFYSQNGEPYVLDEKPIEPIVSSDNAGVPTEAPAQQDKPIDYCFVPKDSQTTFSLRYIIVGNASVGKSCLLLQFVDKTFSEAVGPTIGVDFGSTILRIDNEIVKLQIWDTAGQEDFQAITRAYYREAAVALLVYDVTNRPSFEKLQIWLSNVQQYSTNPNLVIVLVANKMDVDPSLHAVTSEEGREFARLNNLLFIETSAKTGQNVDQIFVTSAYEVITRVKQGVLEACDRNGIKRVMVDAVPSATTVNLQSVAEAGEKKKKCC